MRTATLGRFSRAAIPLLAFALAALAIVLIALPHKAQAVIRLGSANTAALTNGLVGYWPLDGATTNWTTGTTRDLSGFANNGSLQNMSTSSAPAAGKIGQSLFFVTTSGSYINAGTGTSLADLASSSPSTFSFWMKPTGTTTVIMGRNDGNSVNVGWWIQNLKTGVHGLGLVIERASVNLRALAQEPTDGVWTHVTIVYAGDLIASNVKIYYNGVLQPQIFTNDGSGAKGTDASESFYIANTRPTSVSGTSATPYGGNLDDIRVYNRALKSDEVAQLYHLGAATIGHSNENFMTNGLTGYWPLDGGASDWAHGITRSLGSMSGFDDILSSAPTSSTPVAGKIGQAFQFTGIGNSNGIRTAQPIDANGGLCTVSTCTLAAWIKPYGAATVTNANSFNGGAIFSDGNAYLGFYQANVTGMGDKLWCHGWSDATGGEHQVGVSYTVGQWIHMTWVHSNGMLYCYANGVLATSTPMGDLTTLNNFLYIGDGFATGFLGAVDDARIYNRALTQGEISQLYKTGAATIGHSNEIFMTNGLVGYWTFDGGKTHWNTNTTEDSSGNGNTGTLVSMSTTSSPVAGKIGQALTFNGTTNRITIADKAAVHLASGGSVSAWVKPIDTGANGRGRIIDRTTDTAHSNGWEMQLDFNGSPNEVSFGIPSFTCVSTGNNITLNVWQFVTATIAPTGVMRVYVNGADVSDNTSDCATNTTLPPDVSGEMDIGARPGSEDRDFHGAIDDVHVYSRVLTAGEIKQLYNAGR